MRDLAEIKRRALAQTALFGPLSSKDIDNLVAMAKLLKFPARHPLFMKGDPGYKLFIVISGVVRISTVSPEGRETTVNLIHAGKMFGEVAVFDGGERIADATTVDDVEMLAVERRDLRAFLSRNPESCFLMLASCCQRIRWVSELLEDAHYLELPARLAKRLLLLAKTFGKPADDGLRIGIRLSQRELANHMNAARETVNKLLGQWQDERLIKIGHAEITILDPNGLEAYVNGDSSIFER